MKDTNMRFRMLKRMHKQNIKLVMKLLIKYLQLIMIQLIGISCQFSNKQIEKTIIGEWTFAYRENKNNDVPIPLPPLADGNQKQGFIFYKNSICENKLGYFKRENEKLLFLGTKTKYKFENDSLEIFNLTDSTWVNNRIYSLNSDTLTLIESDNSLVKYAKVNYNINEKCIFDKIIVSSSGCFGTCPVSDICIEKQGNVFFSGQYHNAINGLYTSKISFEKYTEFELNFKKANIENLKNYYRANWTDDETITVTFIKGNKIVKTISDYGRQAPTEFYWAYMPVRYCYQQLGLVSYSDSVKLPLFIYRFEQANSVYELAKSEGFFLLMELYNGKLVQQNFVKKYLVECKNDNGEMVKLVTDGRFYRYEQQIDNKSIDIGYDFITTNNFEKREKDEID